jgi:hypothetical protein
MEVFFKIYKHNLYKFNVIIHIGINSLKRSALSQNGIVLWLEKFSFFFSCEMR